MTRGGSDGSECDLGDPDVVAALGRLRADVVVPVPDEVRRAHLAAMSAADARVPVLGRAGWHGSVDATLAARTMVASILAAVAVTGSLLVATSPSPTAEPEGFSAPPTSEMSLPAPSRAQLDPHDGPYGPGTLVAEPDGAGDHEAPGSPDRAVEEAETERGMDETSDEQAPADDADVVLASAAPDPDPEPAPDADPMPEPTPEPGPEPTPAPEPEPEPTLERTPDPDPSPAPESAPEPDPTATPAPEPAPTSTSGGTRASSSGTDTSATSSPGRSGSQGNGPPADRGPSSNEGRRAGANKDDHPGDGTSMSAASRDTDQVKGSGQGEGSGQDNGKSQDNGKG